MQKNDKYRIAYTVPRSRIAGSENALLRLLSGIDSERFESIIICREGGPLVDLLQKFGHKVVVIPRKGRRLAAFLKTYIVLKKNRVHLLHVCSTKLDAICGRLAGVKVIERQNNSGERFFNRIRILQWLYSALVLDRIITVANSMKARLIAQGLQGKKMTTIHNGIALTNERKITNKTPFLQELGIPVDALVFTLVGRLHKQKGHEVLLDAIKLLQNCTDGLFYLFVGEGPLEQKLKFLREQLQLGKSVFFAGYRSDVDVIYAISDVVVIPSLWEPLANVALEAMAAGRPLIASDVDGMKEVVIHNETGLLVPPGNRAKLSEAILTLAGNEEMRKRFGAAARMRITQEFTIEKMVKKTEALFLDCLSNE